MSEKISPKALKVKKVLKRSIKRVKKSVKRETSEKKKPRLKKLLTTQDSQEKIMKKLNPKRKALSLKRKSKEKKGLGVKVIKAEMNSVSKRADYLCKISFAQTNKSTKVIIQNSLHILLKMIN